MSETAHPQNHEPLKNLEDLRDSAEHALPTAEQAKQAEKASQAAAREQLETARQAVEQTAKPEDLKAKLEAVQAAETAPVQPSTVNRELKQITLRRELKSLRRKLPAPSRALSRVIHQPAIRVASEAAGKSISRPSGLLGGGLTAFLGTSGYLYLAKHLGFKYNYGVFIALFAFGFVLGLVLEFLVYAATVRHRGRE